MPMSPTRVSVSPAPLTPLYASSKAGAGAASPDDSRSAAAKEAAPVPEWNLASPTAGAGAALQARASRALARRRNQCRPLLAGLRISSDLAQRALALLLCCIMLTVSSRARAAAALPRPQQQQQSHPTHPREGRRHAQHNSADSSPQRSPSSSSTSQQQEQQQQQQQQASSSSASTPCMPRTPSPTPPPSTPGVGATPFGVGTGSLDSSRLQVPRGGSYYETLLLPPSASPADVKRAYRRLAMRYHPDKVMAASSPTGAASTNAGGAPHRALSAFQCQQLFILVQEAYECLSDPVERRRYDYALRTRTRYKRLARATTHADDEAEPASPASPAPSASSAGYAADSSHSSRRSSYSSSAWGSAASSTRSSRRGSVSGSGSGGGSSFMLLFPLWMLSVLLLRPLWSVALRLPSPLSLLRRFTSLATLAVYCAVYVPVRAAVMANAARRALVAALWGRSADVAAHAGAAAAGFFSALPLSAPPSVTSSPAQRSRRAPLPPPLLANTAGSAASPSPSPSPPAGSPGGSMRAPRSPFLDVPPRGSPSHAHRRNPSVISTSGSDNSSPSLSASPSVACAMADADVAAAALSGQQHKHDARGGGCSTLRPPVSGHPPSLSDADCDADEWTRADCAGGRDDVDGAFAFACPPASVPSALAGAVSAGALGSSSPRALRASASMPNFAAEGTVGTHPTW